MAWIRLDVALFADRAIRRTGPTGRRAFLAAIMLTKERDWRHGERPGFLPATEFDALEVILHWGDPDTPQARQEYTDAIAALAAPGGPIEALPDGSGWAIRNWQKYQPDPTQLARKRRERAARWKAAAGRRPTQKPADEASVTDCHSDAEQPRNGASGDVLTSDVTVTTVTSRYAARDVSRRAQRDETRRNGLVFDSSVLSGQDAPGPASASEASAGPGAGQVSSTPQHPPAPTGAVGSPEWNADVARRRAEREQREADQRAGRRDPPRPAQGSAEALAQAAAADAAAKADDARALAAAKIAIDRDREEIRRRGDLAGIEAGDERYHDAQELLAERPAGSGWMGRAAAILERDDVLREFA